MEEVNKSLLEIAERCDDVTMGLVMKLKQRFFCRYKNCTPERRLNACRRVNIDGETIADVAKDEQVHVETLRNWLNTAQTIRMLVDRKLSPETVQWLVDKENADSFYRARENPRKKRSKKRDRSRSRDSGIPSPNVQELTDSGDNRSDGSIRSPDVIDLTDSESQHSHDPSLPPNQSAQCIMDLAELKNVMNATALEPHKGTKNLNIFKLKNSKKRRHTQDVDLENDSRNETFVGSETILDLSNQKQKATIHRLSSNPAPILDLSNNKQKKGHPSSPVPSTDSSNHFQQNGNYPRSIGLSSLKYPVSSLDLPSHLLTVPRPVVAVYQQPPMPATLHSPRPTPGVLQSTTTTLWPLHDLNRKIIERIAQNSSSSTTNLNFNFRLV